jgi:hypothetical protein
MKLAERPFSLPFAAVKDGDRHIAVGIEQPSFVNQRESGAHC